MTDISKMGSKDYGAAQTNNQNSLDEPRDPIEQILDDFYDGVYIEELPKALAAINKTIMEDLLALVDELTTAGELDATSTARRHPNGIIDPLELRQQITKKYGRAE